MDRRTNGPEGQGGASPTVVASRNNGEDLNVDNDQETRPSDIMAAATRRTGRKPAAAAGSVKTAPPNGHTSNGASGPGGTPSGEAQPADSKDALAPEDGTDHGRAADADATVADAVPALPGDNIAAPASDDWMASGPASFTVEPLPSRPVPPPMPAPASTEPSAMAPAAFVWDMPDPPPTSPSSPARTFLRADANAKSPAPKTPAATVTAPKPAPGPAPAAPQGAQRGAQKKAQSKRSARTAHLTVARVEPWSVMKFSFVVSLVAFVILFVAVSVLYATLSSIGVFESLQHVVSSLTSSQDSAGVNAAHWFSASRVLSYTAILGGFNIVLITAMSTIGAVVYNLTSRLVGGVEVTLRETE